MSSDVDVGLDVALLRAVVLAYSQPELADNVDQFRYPHGFEGLSPQDAPARLGELLEAHAGLSRFYGQLRHPADRELLVRLLAFRILGPRRVQLPLSLDRIRELVEAAEAARVDRRTAHMGIADWYADDFDLAPLGYPLRVRSSPMSVVQTFLLEQYRCADAPGIAVRAGDVVVDGGGYWGETGLYFAHRAGPEGRVIVFECEPGNARSLEYNLSLNPQLAETIAVVPAALWSSAGEAVSVESLGPGTHVTSSGGQSVPTETVDALVARDELAKVDFIKLDIEGTEMSALLGAEETLRRFRPRLAIAAYHRADDLAVIPDYLTSLDLGYGFRLRHYTMHLEETVLFATAENGV